MIGTVLKARELTGERCYGAGGEGGNFVAYINRWSAAMSQPNDLSRSLVALDQDSTIIAVVEMSQSSWLVGGILPGIERQPRKKLEPNPERLLALLHRWRDESVRAGRTITRIAVAFEAGRDGFWLARWLEAVFDRGQIVALPHAAHTRRRDRQAVPLQRLRHPHLTPGRLLDRQLDHRPFDFRCRAVLQHRLAPADLLQSQLAAFVVELLSDKSCRGCSPSSYRLG